MGRPTRPAPRWLGTLAITLLVVLGSLSPAGGVDERARTPGLEFLGEAIIPTGFVFAGTVVGGLSGITYDAALDAYYVLSDDQGQFAPARFYMLNINFSDGRLDPGDVTFIGAITFQGPDGQPFPLFSIDPEGIALGRDLTLVITSEGIAARGIDPFVRVFDLFGNPIRDLPVPPEFRTSSGPLHGVRQNLAFESAGVPPNGEFFFTGTENALIQDGPAATLATGSPSRLLRYNLRTGRPDRQYLYVTDPIAEPPVPATGFAVNGLVELLPLNNEFLLAMERSFSFGVPGTGNTIRLYLVALPGADDINGLPSLAGLTGQVRPAKKALLLDLDVLGIPLDNIEGMTFGPDLPDGRRSLILVSDNNFSALQFTQFLLFAVGP